MNLIGLLYFCLATILGIVTSFLLPLSLPRFIKLLTGPTLGIIFITELTFVVSLLSGFNSLSIALTLISSLCLLVLLSYKRFTLTLFRLPPRKQFVRRYWPLFIILLIFVSITFFVYHNKVLAPSGDGLVSGGGGLYADTALHSSYTMSIVEQGVPPINPLFAGEKLIYPFLVNFFSAILVKLGMSLHYGFMLPQFFYFVAFLALFYTLCRKFTTNTGAFFAILIFLLGWGLGFVQYVEQGIINGNWHIRKEYTNDMGDYQMHNVLTGLVYPERSFLPGLVIGLLITNLFLYKDYNHYNNYTYSILIGILLGILPLWHTHTFLFFGVSVGVWLLLCHSDPPAGGEESHPRQKLVWDLSPPRWRIRMTKYSALTYIVAALIALPVIVWFGSHATHNSFIRFRFGWMESGENFLLFWWLNMGLVIPLATIGLFLFKKHALWFIPAIVLFFVANLFSFQPWDWDTIKLLSWVGLFLVIPAGHALIYLFSLNIFVKITTVIIFITLISSGILSLINQTSVTYTIYDNDDIELAEWVKANTPTTATFLIDPWPTHPLPGLTGRSVYLGYPGHLWVHGIPYQKRESEVNRILKGETSLLSQTEVPISYLITEKRDKGYFKSLSLVYENQKNSVFKIN